MKKIKSVLLSYSIIILFILTVFTLTLYTGITERNRNIKDNINIIESKGDE